MEPMGIIGSIIVGIVAGWIAERVMNRNHGLLTNLIVGLVGGLIGGLVIAPLVPLSLGNAWLNNILFATLGAILLLFLLGLFKRGGRAV